ncbi:MAG: hypothetical protein KDK27_16705, partial [Leptospiraceae bacterium]|nr:hypothetical protein [Leptospiraceae bacterium]
MAALIFSTGCGPVYADRVQPMAQDGVLDLRDWDFKKNGPVELNGEWHFYWTHFLSDIDQAVQPGIITPGPWNEFSYAGRPVGSSGYATYRLRILLPENTPELAIKIGNIDSAARVIVPGKSYSIGTPGRTADTTQPLTRQDVITLPSMDSESMPDHVLDLRIEISNYFHRRGGLLETPTLDESERLHAGVNRERMWQGMLAAIFIMFGLYHLVLYVIRPNAAVFWFGLFCLVIAGRVVLVGEQIIHYWLPELDFRVDLWFEYFDLVLIVPTFSMLLYALFPEDLPRWLRNALVIGGLLFLGLLVLPPLVYSRYVILPLSFMLLTILIALGVVILAVIRRRPTAVTFLLAFVILATGTVSDIVIGILASLSTPFASLGVVGFIFAQAVVLARRFDRAFEQVETLSGELETRNQDLQRLDKLKDEFLANTSHELRTPLNGIIGLTESLRDGVAGNLGDTANRNLNMIIASGKRLASLVNDILDFQKLRNRDIVLSRRPVDVRSLADVVLAISAPLTRGKDLQMRNDIPE